MAQCQYFPNFRRGIGSCQTRPIAWVFSEPFRQNLWSAFQIKHDGAVRAAINFYSLEYSWDHRRAASLGDDPNGFASSSLEMQRFHLAPGGFANFTPHFTNRGLFE